MGADQDGFLLRALQSPPIITIGATRVTGARKQSVLIRPDPFNPFLTAFDVGFSTLYSQSDLTRRA
jgi:hypothetical protein